MEGVFAPNWKERPAHRTTNVARDPTDQYKQELIANRNNAL